MLTEILVPIASFIFMAFVVVGTTRVISDGMTRRRLVQVNASPEMARAITAPPSHDATLQSALKWALVLGAVGLSLVVVQFMPYRPDQPIVYGTVLLFAAGGLLAYYGMERRRTIVPA